MEVEADLADGDDAPLPRQAPQLVVDGLVASFASWGCTPAEAGKPKRLRHAERAPVALLLVDSAHDQHLRDAGLARPGHHLVAVGVELGHVDVAVRID